MGSAYQAGDNNVRQIHFFRENEVLKS